MQRLRSLLGPGGALWLALALVLLFTRTASANDGGTTLYLPLVGNQSPLPADYSVSYYVQTASTQAAYDKGCQLGQTDLNLAGAQDRFVILDFGQPWYDDNGTLGTLIFRVPPNTSDRRAGSSGSASGPGRKTGPISNTATRGRSPA